MAEQLDLSLFASQIRSRPGRALFDEGQERATAFA